MKTGPAVALTTVGFAALAAVIVSCSDGPTCKQGTMSLSVALLGSAFQADTITVTAVDPELNQSVPHQLGDATLFDIEVAFPGGYPANKLVGFVVRAYAKGVLIGENAATVHLSPGCSNAQVDIVGGNTLDASPLTD